MAYTSFFPNFVKKLIIEDMDCRKRIPRKLTKEVENFKNVHDNKESVFNELKGLGYDEKWIGEMFLYNKIKFKNDKYYIGVI
jgi:uncharacterized protein (UPF0335 family)